VAVLYFYGAVRLQVAYGEWGLLVSEIVLLFLPALVFLKGGGIKVGPSLSLRAPTGRGLLSALLIIGGGTPLVWFVTWVQGFVLPMPWEFLEGMSEFLSADTPGRIAFLILVVAVVPAICEETLFRGVLLAGTRRHLTPVVTIVVNGLVFGAFHVPAATIFRFLPSALLGMLLAWVVMRTRSIWTGMLMHFLNNGSIVLMATSPWVMERFSDPRQGPPFWLMVLALGSLLAGAALLEGPRRRSR